MIIFAEGKCYTQWTRQYTTDTAITRLLYWHKKEYDYACDSYITTTEKIVFNFFSIMITRDQKGHYRSIEYNEHYFRKKTFWANYRALLPYLWNQSEKQAKSRKYRGMFEVNS